jgi:hypothetical protein
MSKWDTQFSEQYDDTPDGESVHLLLKYFARNLSDRVEGTFPKALGIKYVTAPALQGDLQFYEYLCEENPCIVSIKNDGPYGYVQCDIKGLRNSEPDFITEVSIKRLLNDQGIIDRPRLTRLIKYAGQIRPYKPSKNPTPDDADDDDIGLEELMVDENDLPF